MSIRSNREFTALRAIGQIVGRALQAMAAAVRPGATTAEIDEVCARFLEAQGARSAAALVYGFPGTACISVNEVAIHGVPDDRKIEQGDIVKLDLVAEKDGYMADAAVTVAVPPYSEHVRDLMRCAERAFHCAMPAARAGNRVREIGAAVEREVERSGYSVMRELCGHGIGRTIHEEPTVPNYADSRAGGRLTEGLVITVEPILAAGPSGRGVKGKDGWSILTCDRSLAAHFEHTIVITKDRPVLLTAA
jgi:methionyl aminopeptidase